jgi:Rv2632c-like
MREWTVRVTLFERGDDTTATVALLADSPEALTARASSHRSTEDSPSPHIGDEVAVARALRRLADGLLARAEEDIEHSTGEADVSVRSR